MLALINQDFIFILYSINGIRFIVKLTLCMLGKNFSSQHFETFFLFFLENMI